MTPLDLWQTGKPRAALAAAERAAKFGDDRAKLLHFEIAAALGRTAAAAAALRSIDRNDEAWTNSRRDFLRLLKGGVRRKRAEYGFTTEAVPVHARARRSALRAARRGDQAAAQRFVDRADAAAPTIAGHVDGREFAELRDIDDGFASVLEVLVGACVLLIPWEQLRRIRLQPAEGLLDTILRPAELVLASRETVACRLPLTYPRSERLGGRWACGRETDRMQFDDGPVRGAGARMLLTHDEEFALGHCRQIDLQPHGGSIPRSASGGA